MSEPVKCLACADRDADEQPRGLQVEELKARVAELEVALAETRAALEWLARTRDLGGCPAEWDIYPVPCDETGECPYPVEDQSDCWLQTALLKVSRRSVAEIIS